MWRSLLFCKFMQCRLVVCWQCFGATYWSHIHGMKQVKKNLLILCIRKVVVRLGYGRVPLNCDGTRWCTGGEVKGKLTNGVGSQSNTVYIDLVVSIEVAIQVWWCCVTFPCIQLLNSGWSAKVFNCLIQFLLTMVLLIEECVFLVEYVFWEGNRYTDLVQEHFAKKFPETPVPHCKAVRRLTEKFRETGSVLDAERSGRPSKLNGEK